MRRQKFRRDKMLNGSSSNKSATYYSLSKPKNCCLEGDILYHQISHSTGFTFDYKKNGFKDVHSVQLRGIPFNYSYCRQTPIC